MKKILILAFALALLMGCSDSSSSSSQSTQFMRININGTEYYKVIGDGYFLIEDRPNCANNGPLTSMGVDQIETSNFFVEVDFTHFSNAINFENNQQNTISNSRLRDDNSVWSGPFANVCDLNNDLTIIYEKQPSYERLYLKPNTTASHNITNVVFESEDSTSKTYKVEGNFNATFLNGNSELPINGNYRILVDVLK